MHNCRIYHRPRPSAPQARFWSPSQTVGGPSSISQPPSDPKFEGIRDHRRKDHVNWAWESAWTTYHYVGIVLNRHQSLHRKMHGDWHWRTQARMSSVAIWCYRNEFLTKHPSPGRIVWKAHQVCQNGATKAWGEFQWPVLTRSDAFRHSYHSILNWEVHRRLWK